MACHAAILRQNRVQMLAGAGQPRQAVGSGPERVKLTKMLASGSVLGDRFRVVRNFAPNASAISVAVDGTGQEYWLVELSLRANEAQVSNALNRQVRFALGVPGLARPVASGSDGELAFVAYQAAALGNVAELHTAAWPVARVARLATRLAAALGPLHDQGIAYGCMTPELIAEGELGPVLFGFGVAFLATAFGAAGEASQLIAPAYRAPELRAALLPPTPASDVFALGVLLGELLLPPSAKSSDAPELTSLAPELQALLASAVALDPSVRPKQVRALAAEFAARAQRSDWLVPTALVPTALVPTALLPTALVPTALVPTALGSGPERVLAVPPLPVQPPRPTVPAPPTPSSLQALLALLVVVLGAFVMVGVVASAFLYAARRAHFAAGRAAVALPALPPELPAPPPESGPEASAEPDEKSLPLGLDAKPERKSDPAHGERAHAPIVAAGVGPNSFAEEARAAMPVLGTEPIWGTRRAPLTWVFFGDLDCPHTRRAWRALEAVKARFGDDLRIVFRHRPLREHPQALEAARVLAGLARRKGAQAFFDVLHRIAPTEASLSPERLSSELSALGYGGLKLSELSAAGEPTVLADLQLAGQFGVRATPYSFLNGLPVEGERSIAELIVLLRAERRSTTWLAAAGVPAAALYTTRTSSNLIGVGDTGEARACAPIGNSPVVGPADALVTLVEFSDFECQYCRRVEPTLKALRARYPKTLRLVWKDFPLPQHKNARLLANFAADAQRRGSDPGFWKVHDGLFAESDTPDDTALGELAGKAGLDGALLLSSAHAGVHDAAIRVDMNLGQALEVSGTPTFFANGRRVQGALPPEQFEALIQSEIETAERIVSRGVLPRDVYGLICE